MSEANEMYGNGVEAKTPKRSRIGLIIGLVVLVLVLVGGGVLAAKMLKKTKTDAKAAVENTTKLSEKLTDEFFPGMNLSKMAKAFKEKGDLGLAFRGNMAVQNIPMEVQGDIIWKPSDKKGAFNIKAVSGGTALASASFNLIGDKLYADIPSLFPHPIFVDLKTVGKDVENHAMYAMIKSTAPGQFPDISSLSIQPFAGMNTPGEFQKALEDKKSVKEIQDKVYNSKLPDAEVEVGGKKLKLSVRGAKISADMLMAVFEDYTKIADENMKKKVGGLEEILKSIPNAGNMGSLSLSGENIQQMLTELKKELKGDIEVQFGMDHKNVLRLVEVKADTVQAGPVNVKLALVGEKQNLEKMVLTVATKKGTFTANAGLTFSKNENRLHITAVSPDKRTAEANVVYMPGTKEMLLTAEADGHKISAVLTVESKDKAILVELKKAEEDGKSILPEGAAFNLAITTDVGAKVEAPKGSKELVKMQPQELMTFVQTIEQKIQTLKGSLGNLLP